MEPSGMAHLDFPNSASPERLFAGQPIGFVPRDGDSNAQDANPGEHTPGLPDEDTSMRRSCGTCHVLKSSMNTATISTPSHSHSNSISTPTAAQNRSSGLDLESYIPVGVLRKRNTSDTGNTETPEDVDGFPSSAIANLEKHNWIRTHAFPYETNPQWSYVRIYILPDDLGRKLIPRSSTALRRALKAVMTRVDRSRKAWEGNFPGDQNEIFTNEKRKGEEDESMWYIFNTLQDPAPQVETMQDPYARQAMEELLLGVGQEDSGVIGLKTALYPYQRRSAAMMVQREAQPARMLDPRLQACTNPLGHEYYYDKEEGCIFHEKKMYSEACGGILAETMGCGKTLICLAVILATQGHFPRIPLQYYQQIENPVREKTASLVEMAAAAAGRYSLPWKRYFDSLKSHGLSNDRCAKACETNRGNYTIPSAATRQKARNGVAYPRPPPQNLRLCSGTLIVVPPNLVDHWESEIAKHTEGLKVRILRNSSDETPSVDELLQYDIVLFSRIRLEKEAGELVPNRRVSVKPEDSPLTKVHWLRIIVDEGHNVAGHGQRTNMVHLLDQLQVERRWIVSGTPSSGLYGVEVSLASRETYSSESDLSNATNTALRRRRKTGSALESELKDLDKLRHIVVEFLDLKPWSNSRADDPANWTKYMKPVGEDGKRRKAPSLRATLQSLVVRHRMDTIHGETPLPPLSNKVVHLEPTFYDQLSLNMFIAILGVNAITSERTDQDYMFHPRNRKHLSLTISNLRQAGFWWAGFDEQDISGTKDVAIQYLQKNREQMSEDDIAMMAEGIRIAQIAICCGSRSAFRQYHELGVFVQDFPAHARSLWALDPSTADIEPLLLGISQARQAQQFINSHLNTEDPAEGLAGAGIKARRELAERQSDSVPTPTRMSTPVTSPKKTSTLDKSAKKNSPKKSFPKGLSKSLPKESPLARTKLVATASAKLTYLLDRVLELQEKEKIIIFYDNNNIAFWIAEGLEMIGVEFRIYANTLKPALRTAYLALFREDEEVRVLLMDLRQASHGLHLANASRVFIVNPIWQPNVESQAIKRAHRIGQTRPVYVETLVLKDTLEDKMLQRRKEMSDSEIQHAEKDLLDDSTMNTIIQNEKFIPMFEDGNGHANPFARLAFLKNPVGLFDRHKLPVPDSFDSAEGNGKQICEGSPLTTPVPSPSKTSAKRKRKTLRFDTASANASPKDKQDDGPDLLTPNIKRRKNSAAATAEAAEYVNGNGIVMTPSRPRPPRNRNSGSATPLPTPPPPSFFPLYPGQDVQTTDVSGSGRLE
ncbi:DEAD/DEAH box helicase [Aspergillus chevalieri]|uniref:Helicase C-terminal domain-containing protein n=1 Tax=Aspergillus chevalieri TaxID=182096 RepID=A0A7R7VEY8_ASPCH|nr:uncharacterized protein ACHE_10816S [Aspergillus chevalieri]BCR83414.1 hypothetical protein ACHE_10816S [Aspergillus chevalieri]